MKPVILMPLFSRHYLNYLGPVVAELLKSERAEIFFLAGNGTIAGDIRTSFPGCDVFLENEPGLVDRLKPDIIVCCEIWFFCTGALKRARDKNIPVLMYDHGSLYHICEYLLENDEYTTTYRAALGLCSHIACWGEFGRDCWLSYGAAKEKMVVTGALQYDRLYRSPTSAEEVYARLNVKPGKKIILLFSTLHHEHPCWRKRNIDVTRQLENFVKSRDEYQLVVKHHPLDMSRYPKCPYPYSSKTILINDPREAHWENTVIIDPLDVIGVSFAVSSIASSVLVGPVSANVPIIHNEVENPSSKYFSNVVAHGFFNFKKGERIDSIIKQVEKNGRSVGRKKEMVRLAAAMNYNNDGRAGERFLELIDGILQERREGKNFYPLTIEEEFLENVKTHPHLPYTYQHLVHYYLKEGNAGEMETWLKEYCRRFNTPSELLKDIALFYFAEKQFAEAVQYIEEYERYGAPDSQLLFKKAVSHRMLSDYRKAVVIFRQLLTRRLRSEYKKEIIYELGLALLLNGELKRAISTLKKCLEISDDNKNINYRSFYRLGEAYVKNKQYKLGIKSLECCLGLCSTHRAAGDLLALAQQKQCPVNEVERK